MGEPKQPDPREGYSPPVARLLSYGDPRDLEPWPDYVTEPGLTGEDVPELVRLATDVRLWTDPASHEASVAWAGPIHAWRALALTTQYPALRSTNQCCLRMPHSALFRSLIPNSCATRARRSLSTSLAYPRRICYTLS